MHRVATQPSEIFPEGVQAFQFPGMRYWSGEFLTHTARHQEFTESLSLLATSIAWKAPLGPRHVVLFFFFFYGLRSNGNTKNRSNGRIITNTSEQHVLEIHKKYSCKHQLTESKTYKHPVNIPNFQVFCFQQMFQTLSNGDRAAWRKVKRPSRTMGLVVRWNMNSNSIIQYEHLQVRWMDVKMINAIYEMRNYGWFHMVPYQSSLACFIFAVTIFASDFFPSFGALPCWHHLVKKVPSVAVQNHKTCPFGTA